MTQQNLKPCPFCGAQPKMEMAFNEFWVRCECGATVPMTCLEGQAAEMWNRRAEDVGLEDGSVAITMENCREVTARMSKSQLLGTVLGLMDVLDEDLARLNKMVSIVSHFEKAYKTHSTKKVMSALGAVFDKPRKRTVQ